MRFTSLCFVLLAAVLLAPAASASCAPFLSVVAEQSKVINQGQNAAYSILVTNTGPSSQSFSASTLCDSTALDCGFDSPFPLSVASGQTTTFHATASAKNNYGNFQFVLQVTGGTGGDSCIEQRTLMLGVVNASTGQAAEPFGLGVTVSPAGPVGEQPGNTIEYTIVVQNNKPELQFVQLKYGIEQGNPFVDSTYSNGDEFQLQAGDAKTITLLVAIPPGTPGGSYAFPLLVRGTTPSAVATTAMLPIKVFVFSPTLSMQWASTPAACLSAFHTKNSEHLLAVRNLGEITGPFDAELEVIPGLKPYLKLSATTFELAQREATVLAVEADMPTSVAAGTFPYNVKIKYRGAVVLRFDSCVTIMGVKGIDALAQAQFEAVRGAAQTVYLSVRNNGSVSANYSIEYDPVPLRGTSMLVNPSSFYLRPNETRDFAMTIIANLTAPLGTHYLPLTLRTTGQSKTVYLVLDLISSNNSGQSPLQITAPRFKVFEGMPSQFAVTVRNNGFTDFEAVQLAIEGLPPGWVSVNTQLQGIARSREKDFLVTFNIPQGTNRGAPSQLGAFAIHAVAGLESASAPAFVEITTPVRQLGLAVDSVSQEVVQQGDRALVKVAVYNKGNIPLTNIRPSLPYSTEYTVSQDLELDLGPGAQTYVTVSLSPTASTSSKDVLLRFSSAEGAEMTQAVRIPALSTTQQDAEVASGLVWKAALILLLLLAILVALGRDEIDGWMGSPAARKENTQPPSPGAPSQATEPIEHASQQYVEITHEPVTVEPRPQVIFVKTESSSKPAIKPNQPGLRKLSERVSGIERDIAIHEGETRVAQRVITSKINEIGRTTKPVSDVKPAAKKKRKPSN